MLCKRRGEPETSMQYFRSWICTARPSPESAEPARVLSKLPQTSKQKQALVYSTQAMNTTSEVAAAVRLVTLHTSSTILDLHGTLFLTPGIRWHLSLVRELIIISSYRSPS